jgi:integrase/recombinase XerC
MNQQADLERFYAYLTAEKRYSHHTLASYRRDLKAFTGFCGEISSWDAIDQKKIRAFVASQHRKGLGGKSLQRQLSAIRSLYRFLCRHDLASTSPAQGVPAPKASKRLPKTLQVDELSQLLAVKNDSPLALRDIAMMELLYGCGLRLAELSGLNLQDLDWQQSVLTVTGKGRKQRRIPFGKKAASAVKKWLPERALLLKQDNPALFISQRGQRISHSSIAQRLKKWALEQGISSHVNPHKLRHSFASHILESSSDLRAVQELLGHANLSTTQIYTHLDFQHLASVYDKAHPRAHKKT